MANLTLSREMQNMAERLAENSHDIWARKKKEEMASSGSKLIDISSALMIFHRQPNLITFLQVEDYTLRWFPTIC